MDIFRCRLLKQLKGVYYDMVEEEINTFLMVTAIILQAIMLILQRGRKYNFLLRRNKMERQYLHPIEDMYRHSSITK